MAGIKFQRRQKTFYTGLERPPQLHTYIYTEAFYFFDYMQVVYFACTHLVNFWIVPLGLVMFSKNAFCVLSFELVLWLQGKAGGQAEVVEKVSPAKAAEGGPWRSAGLTVNPVKFVIAREKTEYLGFTFGGGVIKPHAIESCPLPQTRKEVQTLPGNGWLLPLDNSNFLS